MSSKKDLLGWQCETCQKKYTKERDKVMECEFCEGHFFIGCLDMTPTTYYHHSKSSAMWFCVACMPKTKETIKIEKDIEKRCNEHYKKFEKICSDLETKLENKITDVEQKVNTKCSKQEVEKIVNDKLETFEVKNDKNEMEKNVQNTVTDMVDTKIVNKIAENGRELANSQSRQKMLLYSKQRNQTLT